MAIELHHLNTHGMMEQAGKVLDGVAKLKARIAELEQNLSEIQSQKMQLEDDVALLRRNNAELRHQKYERCIDKANYWVAISYHCVDDKHRQRAERHHRKWLEIAKQFKEAK